MTEISASVFSTLPTVMRGRRLGAALLGLALVAPMLAPAMVLATSTTVFDQPFHNNTANGIGTVSSLPAVPSGSPGTNLACLTASGNTTTGVLLSCPSANTSPGSGALRLTTPTKDQQGGIFGATSISTTSQALDATFNIYQYGGNQADGTTFALAATDPADPQPPTVMGQGDGSLAYSAVRSGSLSGLPNAYLGFGLDAGGFFSSSAREGTDCTDPAYISTVAGGKVPGQVVVRGPGQGALGYCAINSTATNTSSPVLALNAGTRAASGVPVEVVINPLSSTIVTASGLSVAAGQYKIQVTLVGGTVKTLTGALPTVPAGLYPSSTWLNAAGIPKELTFGWTAATGTFSGFNAYHEVDDAKVVTISADPVLTVAQTSYAVASPAQGDPVTYTVTAGVASGTDQASTVTVTETVPSGVVPLGASTGTISGTPTLAGPFSFTIRVADSGDQVSTQPTSLTVNPGQLSISVPASANIGSAAAGSPTLSGQTGSVTVTDNRGSASAFWGVTASSTSFTTGTASTNETVPINKIAYSAGSGNSTGTGTFVPASLANGSLPGTGASWTSGTGANSVTWNPTLTFTLSPSQVAGLYTGIITHTVA